MSNYDTSPETLTPNADDEAVMYKRHAVAPLLGTVDTNAALSLPLNPGVAVEQDVHGHQKSAKPKVQPRGDRDFGAAARRRGARSRIRRRSGNRHWVAPLVPLHPASNGQVRVQLKAEKAGQPPDYRLADFTVNQTQAALAYDGNGALFNLPSGLALAYDAEENLATVISNGTAVTESWYDAAGRRIAKREGGVLTLYLWDGMEILATANADGTIREYYTRGPGIAGDVGSLIAETRFSGGAASTTFLHGNHRGDVVLATDGSGAVTGRYGYSAFGMPLASSGTYATRFGFSSKERDASGLVYYGFRFHLPELCRWVTPDPIREDGGLNLYRFCDNDPVNFVDPWGLIKWDGDKATALRDQYIKTKHGAAKVTAIESKEIESGITVTVKTDPKGGNNYNSLSRIANICGSLPNYRSNDELIKSDIREILNHELDHALYQFGTDSGGYGRAGRPIPGDPMHSVLERHAVEDTNILRSELGRKPRTKCSDEEGQWINGVYWPKKMQCPK